MRRVAGYAALLLSLTVLGCNSSEHTAHPATKGGHPAQAERDADTAPSVDDELASESDGEAFISVEHDASVADEASAPDAADLRSEFDASASGEDASVAEDAALPEQLADANAPIAADAELTAPDAANLDADDPSAADSALADASSDACTSDCTTPPAFVPVRFSSTDRSSCIALSPSGYEVELTDWGPCGVRSDAAIAPGSGVFYFEGERLTPRYKGGGLGVASALAALNESAGASAQSMGVLATGAIQNAGGSCSGSSALDSSLPDLGFVVDYRAATPIIHMLQASASGGAVLAASCGMALGTPLHVFYSGDRAKVGYELRINTGADTTNFPFHFSADQVRAALIAGSQAATASALVLGFGKTHAAALDAAPTLEVSADVSLPLGQGVLLEASASDAEDGVLDASIEWLDLASQHHAPIRGSGAHFSFVPSSIGRHPVRVTVRDAAGVSTSKTVMVKVTGALPQAAPAQLVHDALTGPGIAISPDGLSASFNGTSKDGIRANQGVYGRFWYFEVHRSSAIRNMGMGLVTEDGALNPYEPARVPWSCSLNVLRGFWINLIDAGDFPHDATDLDYGFAVDYRAEHPRVHILIHGALETTLALDDVWVPLYPMLYGNPPETPVTGPDLTLNFGTTPFAFDARTILSAAGIDVTGFEAGWGLSLAELR